jgi:parvulin-like peptidyl-prolyl isomerase
MHKINCAKIRSRKTLQLSTETWEIIMRKLALGIVALSLLTFTGCGKLAQIDNSKQLLKVNNAPITQKMFDKMFDMVYKSSPMASNKFDIKNPENKFVYLMFKDRAVRELIIRELIKQEAEKRNIKIKKEEIDKTFNEISEKMGGKEKLQASLTLNGLNKEDFIESIRLDLVAKKLLENLALNIKPTDKELLDFYNKNKKAKFIYPDQVRASHILISANLDDIKAKLKTEKPGLTKAQQDKKAMEEINSAKVKALGLLAQLKANPSKFEEFAKKYSDDPSSAAKGGDLGFFSKNDMVPEFSRVAFSLTPGKTSDVVTTLYGFHIIKVQDHKTAGIMPFTEVKNDISKYIVDMQKMELMQKLIESSKNSANIVYLDKSYDPAELEIEARKAPQPQAPTAPSLETGSKAEKK